MDYDSKERNINAEKRTAAKEELEKANLALSQLIDEEKSVTEALAKLKEK